MTEEQWRPSTFVEHARWVELGLRVEQVDRFKWKAGMLAIDCRRRAYRIDEVNEDEGFLIDDAWQRYPDGLVPDLRDPATLALVLARLRECLCATVWVQPDLSGDANEEGTIMYQEHEAWSVYRANPNCGQIERIGEGGDYAEALVDAMESAHNVWGSR